MLQNTSARLSYFLTLYLNDHMVSQNKAREMFTPKDEISSLKEHKGPGVSLCVVGDLVFCPGVR